MFFEKKSDDKEIKRNPDRELKKYFLARLPNPTERSFLEAAQHKWRLFKEVKPYIFCGPNKTLEEQISTAEKVAKSIADFHRKTEKHLELLIECLPQSDEHASATEIKTQIELLSELQVDTLIERSEILIKAHNLREFSFEKIYLEKFCDSLNKEIHLIKKHLSRIEVFEPSLSHVICEFRIKIYANVDRLKIIADKLAVIDKTIKEFYEKDANITELKKAFMPK